jgi:hypothetical protein
MTKDAMQWHPIETHDGSDAECDIWIVENDVANRIPDARLIEGQWCFLNHGEYEPLDDCFTVTHWMEVKPPCG